MGKESRVRQHWFQTFYRNRSSGDMKASTKVNIVSMSLFAVVFITFVVSLMIFDTEEFQPIRKPVLVGIGGAAFINFLLVMIVKSMRRMEETLHDS